MVYNRLFFNRIAAKAHQPCALCGIPGEHSLPICLPCKLDLPRSQYQCEYCALPLPRPASNHRPKRTQSCGQCLSQPPLQSRCLAAFQYGFPVRELITTLKFQRNMVYGRVLGTLLGDFIAQQYQQHPQHHQQHQQQAYPDAVIAVPLSNARLKERGFNQAAVIGKYALQEINRQSNARPPSNTLPRHSRPQPLKLLTNSIEKVLHTPAQTSLSGHDRKQALKHAFRIKPGWDPTIQSIALIDDVYTTGATLKTISELFKEQGVQQIHFWCVARAI